MLEPVPVIAALLDAIVVTALGAQLAEHLWGRDTGGEDERKGRCEGVEDSHDG
jgi:hypothetical protein